MDRACGGVARPRLMVCRCRLVHRLPIVRMFVLDGNNIGRGLCITSADARGQVYTETAIAFTSWKKSESAAGDLLHTSQQPENIASWLRIGILHDKDSVASVDDCSCVVCSKGSSGSDKGVWK